AGLVVDLGADVVVRAIARLGALLDRLFDRLDDDLALDVLLAGDRVGDLQEFLAVGGNTGDGHQALSSEGVVLSVGVSTASPSGRPSSSGSPRAARMAAPRFIRASVRTSLASASQSKGIRAVSSSPSRSIRTLPSSYPARTP